MAKKKVCGYDQEITNGAKAGITMAIIGGFASIMKRLGKKHRKTPTPRRRSTAVDVVGGRMR